MLRPTNCLSVLDYFEGLAPKGLIGHMVVLNWTPDLEMVYGGQFWILVAWWLIYEMHTLYILKCTIQSQFDSLGCTSGTLRTRSALARLKCYRKNERSNYQSNKTTRKSLYKNSRSEVFLVKSDFFCNYTSEWVLSCKFAAYFQNTFY